MSLHDQRSSDDPPRDAPSDEWRELRELLEALCEQRLDRAAAQRLERIVLADAAARRLYLDYIELHGSLYWDAASADEEFVPAEHASPVHDAARQNASKRAAIVATRPGRMTGRIAAAAVAIALSAAVLIGVAALRMFDVPANDAPRIADTPAFPETDHPPVVPQRDAALPEHSRGERPDRIVAPDRSPARGGAPSPPPLPIANAAERRAEPRPDSNQSPSSSAAVAATPGHRSVDDRGEIPPGGSSAETIVAFLDSRFQAGWEAAEVVPSPVADDAEWIRRAYLDIAGHVPPAEAVERFLADPRSDRRARLVESLLDEPAYARHWGTVWTNLLVGRTQGRAADREGLERFLRQGFARNRPWSELVAEMVSAEGNPEENGATGFLLAHLNNEAVPATAVTARVFLGTQVQCTQCHDHPFNDWQQNHFWDLNSFFQQTAAIDVPAERGRGRSRQLVSKAIDGPLYYENRQGLMRVAYPRFDGERVDPGPETNRRAELARLIVAGDKPQLAEAFVNRVWAQFFGYGFTNPVDDMGPHNPPTHPAVLDRLSREFVASGFDTKRLIRWITATRAYQTTSRMNESNVADDPARGEPPLFSRMYVRPMSPEQLYDSLVIATQPRVAGGPDWREAHRRRREWLAQFIHPQGTEENDEAMSFAGTVPQALMLMNGELTAGAVSSERGTFLSEVLAEPISETEKIRKLSLAALSRHPTPAELEAFRRLWRHDAREDDRQATLPTKYYEDLFWALLNSSEFVHVH